MENKPIFITMKKLIIITLGLLFMGSSFAQEPTNLQKSWREFIHKRDISKRYLESNIPLSTTMNSQPAMTAKHQYSSALPADRWFPGEWEEVQAIVVTPYYEYLVPGHENDQYWYADPLVTGHADYYHYSNGWRQQGSGPYVITMDTTSTFGNTFFYLMDGIQLGGAEAWVHVEQASDSNIVLRKLERMNLRHENVKFIVGPGNSFWYRDCGPICFYFGAEDSVAMLDFMYYPGRALDDSLPSLIEQQMNIPNYMTQIEWEGGNCVVDGAGMVLSSDAIYSNNMDDVGQITWNGRDESTINYETKQRLTKAQVKDSLASLLGPRACYILPAFKYDGGTGHVDLYCDMWDENEFVFSKFPDYYSNWRDYATASKNIDSLSSYQSYFGNDYKKHFIPFPCKDNGTAFSSQASYNDSYTRTYSNHTFVNNVILQPVFSTVQNGEPTKEWDRRKFDSLKLAYPGYTLYPINVKEFDGSGGAIHCITKQIPADNPVRILHPSYTGMQNQLAGHNAEISAIVTNRSGIDNVKLYWRVDGNEWETVDLVQNDPSANEWSGIMEMAGIDHADGSYNTFEYYLSATSNNGKTITKPMTAAQGGYYTFYIGENVPVSINTVSVEEAFGQFFPNPSSEQAHIQIEMSESHPIDINIVDLTGRTIYHSTIQPEGDIIYTLNTNRLAKGVYSVVFSSPEGQVVRRLVIE